MTEQGPTLRTIGDVQCLAVKDGDRFVIAMLGPISFDEYNRLGIAWRSFVKGDDRAPILRPIDAGATIGQADLEH